MNGLLVVLSVLLGVGILFIAPGDGPMAILVCIALAVPAAVVISRAKSDRDFFLLIFLGGLLVRVLIGLMIYAFKLQEFFGGDANTYDLFGYALLKGWQGDQYYLNLTHMYRGENGSGWGMLYMVAAIYRVTGRNMLAVQFFNSVIGAATAPVISLCALQIFGNRRVAHISAFFAAFYPSLVLWSSQGLKDGPIVFLLGLSILVTLKLGEKMSVKYLVILVLALFALLSLRFYVFYMMAAAIGGAFIIGMRPFTATGFVRQFVIILCMGLALTYLGVTRMASGQFQTYGNLEAVQRSRLDLAQTGQSGFGRDVDVSTTSGALSVIPIGLLYLLFAPFPWQLANLRQSITLPEMIVWWASFPLLVLGLWFTIRYRLRQSSPILIFTSMLTLAYSVFQGNVGTAYRQRAQLLVFYFIFVAVGFILLKEKHEERKQQERAEREAFAERQLAALESRKKQRSYAWAGAIGKESEES
ncbi:MAG TPA: glycosyltransferase family 39 protein [Pyrinomonadaceae bacterium]|nr:glycosyltransferase family 39 protein [Pyrinomonadaceae bacterium]